MYLIILILIPTVGFIHLISLPKWDKKSLEQVSLFWSLITFSWFSYMIYTTPCTPSFHHTEQWNWFSFSDMSINWGSIVFGLDGISIFLIGLSILLIPICIIMSWSAVNFMKKEFLLSLYVMLMLLMGVFTMLDVLGFYILFEGILMPMFIVIGVWGSSEEKVSAAFYFFFYTLVGSLLMLVSIFKLYSIYGTTNYLTLVACDMPAHLQFWLFFGFFCSLAVKMPMVPTHIWLPQAHVEAPIAGSVLLAGILLKLGGYGFMRFAYPLFPIASEFIAPFMMLLSVIAIIYASFTTCSQTDIKSLIAYSSVAHMGLVTLALFTHSLEGLMASMIMMLAHGLVSSGLFMTSAVVYVSHHSSAMSYFSGMTSVMPIFSSLTLILMLANMGFPLTFNFMAEFLAMLAALNYSYMVGVLSCMGALFSVVYALYFYNSVYFGQLSPHLFYASDINAFEFQGFLPLLVLTLLLGILPNLVMTLLNSGAYYNISL